MKYSLTDTATRNAKPKPDGKAAKLSDGGGLYLKVTTTGKYWRYDYTHDGKRKTLAIGVYPDTGLKAARDAHQKARELLAAGQDPSTQKQAAKAERANDSKNSFETIAREWHAKFSASWSERHAENVLRRLEANFFPTIGSMPITTIDAPLILKCLRKIESRGAVDTAHRAKTETGAIFRYAIATGRAVRDVAADLKGALSPQERGHFAAITEPAKVGRLMLDIEGYNGAFGTVTALRLSAYLFQRPCEIRRMEWEELNLGAGLWEIPPHKIKMKNAHIVPLPTQAIELIRGMEALTGCFKYVFISRIDPRKPMGNGTINNALRNMGYASDEMTAHGFRALARTILDEELEVDERFIEKQLAHKVKDANGTAYNRTKHLKQRIVMMQEWAYYLDGLRESARQKSGN